MNRGIIGSVTDRPEKELTSGVSGQWTEGEADQTDNFRSVRRDWLDLLICPHCSSAIGAEQLGSSQERFSCPSCQSRLTAGPERFPVLHKIGQGGMGVVYETFDHERESFVALKTMTRVSPDGLYRFKQEFRSLAELVHPNLVPLYELVSDGGKWFFTMQLVRGVDFLSYVTSGLHDTPTAGGEEVTSLSGAMQTLSEVTMTADAGDTVQASEVGAVSVSENQIAQDDRVRGGLESLPRPSIDFERLRSLLGQLSEALCFLHESGKLHRDIKPSNVLVTNEGRVVVLDFGLVADLGGPAERGASGTQSGASWGRQGSSPQTSRSKIVGTLSYMAPEQAVGDPLTPASDWYSLGVMLYAALTGRLPYRGSNQELLKAKLTLDPAPISSLVSGIPEDLNSLCMDLLRRDARLRPSGTDILARLNHGKRGGRKTQGRAGPITSQFVGRENHLAALKQTYQMMLQGNAVTAYVHGKSGVGKTALIQKFLQELDDRTVILTGRCYEQESVPFKALDSLIDTLGRYLLELPREEADRLMPRNISALARVFPVLDRVESVSEAPGPVAEIPDAQEMRRRAFSALRELLARIGDRQPLVLYIDDVHWGDVDSAALLAELLRPPDPPRLLLLAAYRREYEERSDCLRTLRVAEKERVERIHEGEIRVDPLSPEQSTSLARELLDPSDPLVNEKARRISRESRGYPYFIFELAAHMRANTDWAAEQSAASRELDLDEVLWTRVGRLPDEARRLLEVVSVAGQPLPSRIVFETAGIIGRQQNVVARLRSENFVRGTGPGLEDEIETFHDRIRESVTAHLPENVLREHHAGLAGVLEAEGHPDPEVLAVHFDGAGDNEKAAGYYVQAGDRAARILAFERAARLYSLSMERKPLRGAEASEIHRKRADCLSNAGLGVRAAEEYIAACQGADESQIAALQRRAGYCYCTSGRLDEGQDVLRSVLGRIGLRMPPTPFRALLSLLWHRLLLVIRGFRYKLRPSSEVPPKDLERLDVIWATSLSLATVDFIRGADFQTRNLLLALRVGEPRRLARALAWEASTSTSFGWRARGRFLRRLDEARAVAEPLDDPDLRGFISLSEGVGRFFLAEYPDAISALEDSEKTLREHCTGVAWELGTAQFFSDGCLFHTGSINELRARNPRLTEEARQRGDLYLEMSISNLGATLYRLADDDPAGALDMLDEVIGRWTQKGFHAQHYLAEFSKILIYLYRGEAQTGWRQIEKTLPEIKKSRLLRIQEIRFYVTYLRAICALAAADEVKEPKRFLDLSAKLARLLRQERSPRSRPWSDMILASVTAFRGHESAAAELLKSAITGFRDAGMHLDRAIAQRRLGQLVGGDEGHANVSEAEGWMRSQGIRNLDRLSYTHSPGFGTLVGSR